MSSTVGNFLNNRITLARKVALIENLKQYTNCLKNCRNIHMNTQGRRGRGRPRRAMPMEPPMVQGDNLNQEHVENSTTNYNGGHDNSYMRMENQIEINEVKNVNF